MLFMENILVNKCKMTSRDWLVDCAVVLVTLAVAMLQLMLTASSIIVPDLALRQYLGLVNVVPSASLFVGTAFTVLPLILRRRFPLPVFLVCFVAFFVLQVLNTTVPIPIPGLVVALYTVTYIGGISVGSICGIASALSLFVGGSTMQSASMVFFTRFQNIAIVIAAVLAGYAYRTHKAYVAEVKQRAADAERSREEEAARRVEAERVKIAREIHDITAHSLSAVNIQLTAALRLIDNDTETAKQALETARKTSKDALSSIRSMVGVLRHGSEVAETTPTSSTAQLLELTKFLEGANIKVHVDQQNYIDANVPAHIDVALFNVAREACTNIIKHANATEVSIKLEVKGSIAKLTITDNGCGCDIASSNLNSGDKLPEAKDGKGNGILGMAERVQVLGGHLIAGNNNLAKGFVVSAAIPLEN